jgi:hypothetical protein
MDEQSRRSLHELITRAVGGDAHARTVIEELVLSLNRSGAAEDVSQALQCCMFSSLRAWGTLLLLAQIFPWAEGELAAEVEVKYCRLPTTESRQGRHWRLRPVDSAPVEFGAS